MTIQLPRQRVPVPRAPAPATWRSWRRWARAAGWSAAGLAAGVVALAVGMAAVWGFVGLLHTSPVAAPLPTVIPGPAPAARATPAPPARTVTPSTPATRTASRSADLSRYAGRWEAHGVGVTVDRTGKGTVSFRTYNWCDGSAAVPTDPGEPCETPGQDLDAGHATVQFEASGSGLTMRTLSSNDRKLWPVGQRQTVRLLRSGVMEISSATASPWGLCRAPASDGICGG